MEKRRQMSHEKSTDIGGRRSLFNMNLLEWVMIGALLITLVLTSLDAVEGRHVGTGDALNIAKLQGQQGMVASVSNKD